MAAQRDFAASVPILVRRISSDPAKLG